MRRLAEEILAAAGNRRPARLAIVDGQAREVLRQAHAAAVASGTATLEASLMRCPTVLVYRVSPPTFFLARRLVKGVRFIGLANILAGREIMPELIQDAFSPEAVAARLRPWLRDPAARAAAVAGLDAVNRQLGEGGASDRAAEAVIETIRYSAPFVMGAPAAAKASSSAQRL
jgi:lipid-A-disaccharide synthase